MFYFVIICEWINKIFVVNINNNDLKRWNIFFLVHFFESDEDQFHRRRTRVSLDGQFCTHLEEKEPCLTVDDDCPVYNWTLGEWSDCQLAEDSHCGYGLRVRGKPKVYE